MRALWTQVPRPKLRGSPSSSIDSTCSALVRRTTTKPLKRRAGFNDAFTVLLAPVLAAALIVDTSWKAKQRRDWDEKLGAISEEINQLQEREQYVWSSLQHRSFRHGLRQQARGYATAAEAYREEEEDDDTPDLEEPSFDDDLELAQQHDPPVRRVTILDPEVYNYSAEELSKFTRYHRLNATVVALQMLVHVRFDTDPRWILAMKDDPVAKVIDPHKPMDDLPLNSTRLSELLAKTRMQLRALEDIEGLRKVAPKLQRQALQGNLHHIVKDLTEKFDAGQIPLQELVHGYVRAVLQSDDIPACSTYVLLLRSLSKAGNFHLAYLITNALHKSTLPLSNEALVYMIYQFGKMFDSRSLKLFLLAVARSDSRVNAIDKWEMTRVNGLDLPVPRSLNPRLLQVLVYSALRCWQPDRAEAWSSFFQETNFNNVWKGNLFRSFMDYYSAHGDWDKGKVWLQRSIRHAEDIGSHSMDRLSRVIFRMLYLCVRCGKIPEYTTILDAAVKAGIPPAQHQRTANGPRPLPARYRIITAEWETLRDPTILADASPEERAKVFQAGCGSLLEVGHPSSSNQNRPAVKGIGDVELTAPIKSHRNLQYSARRQGELSNPQQREGDPSEIDSELTAVITAKLAQQDADISMLTKKLAAAEVRQEHSQRKTAERAERWLKSSVQLSEELARSKALCKHLQSLQNTHQKEHQQLRQEVADLRAVAQDLMRISQESKADGHVDRTLDEVTTRTVVEPPPPPPPPPPPAGRQVWDADEPRAVNLRDFARNLVRSSQETKPPSESAGSFSDQHFARTSVDPQSPSAVEQPLHDAPAQQPRKIVRMVKPRPRKVKAPGR